MITLAQDSEERKSLNRSGIYYIVCRTSKKYYVGSAVNIWNRWIHHRAALRRGKHDNGRLQNAWNKYGEDDFYFGVIEFIPSHLLLEREQFWIDAMDVADRDIGYNIGSVSGSPRGCKRSEEFKTAVSRSKSSRIEGFISPEGEIVHVDNLRDFCKQHGLATENMRAVYRGRAISHKGWRHVSPPKLKGRQLKVYDGFIDPNGDYVGPISGLHRFCKDRGLDTAAMIRIIRGKEASHKGWTYKPVAVLEAV